jgi:tetratricopeptide (TPR) repeat protein
MSGQPVKLIEGYSERLAKAASVAEVELLIDDIRDELSKRANPELSELLIRANFNIGKLDDAEDELNRQLNLYQPENIPVNLLFYKAHIENNKRTYEEAIKTIDLLIETSRHNAPGGDNRKIKVNALVDKAFCLGNMGRMREMFKIVEEIFSILKPGENLNIFADDITDILARECDYTTRDGIRVGIINGLREYKKGLELVEKDKHFNDVYKYITATILKRDNMLYDAYPTILEGDWEYPFDEQAILISTKGLRPEDKFKVEIEIEDEIDYIFPNNYVLVFVK